MTTPPTADITRVTNEARAAWPDLALDVEGFARHVTTHVTGTLDGVHAGDLFLAFGCAAGDEQAVACFMDRHHRTLQGAARRFAADGAHLEDLVQMLKAHFLVDREARRARIANYRGTGPLEGWLRVASVRRLVDDRRARSRRPEEERSDGLVDALAADGSWELDFLKTRYRQAFREAFAAAVLSLGSEQRNLLRFQTVDGLTLDQIASLHGMHRSSVDRRIQSARRSLLMETRLALGASLEADEAEVESIMRLIHSRLDVSLSRLLRPITAAPLQRSSSESLPSP